jgi:large subunit ribosomal protein L24
MKIKKGDTVRVIAGADRGSVGEVIEAIPAEERVRVAGVATGKMHVKPGVSAKHPEGGIVSFERPVHVSNVMLVVPGTQQASRIGSAVVDGKKVRIGRGKSSGTSLESSKA